MGQLYNIINVMWLNTMISFKIIIQFCGVEVSSLIYLNNVSFQSSDGVIYALCLKSTFVEQICIQ